MTEQEERRADEELRIVAAVLALCAATGYEEEDSDGTDTM